MGNLGNMATSHRMGVQFCSTVESLLLGRENVHSAIFM